MKKLVLISLLAIFFANYVSAQSYLQYKGEVEIIDVDEDGSKIRLQVEFTSVDAGTQHLARLAGQTALCELFFNGVEGVNNDEKLIRRDNIQFFEKFFRFDGKSSPHIRFIEGVQQVGKPKKTENKEFQVVYHVEVKYKALVNEMKLHKLSEADASIVRVPEKAATQFN